MREIIVDPLTGRWHTVGDNGAEFAYVPKHALVFNHLQSEQLLKNGFVASRASAFAYGTAFASGTAYASPVGINIPINSVSTSATKNNNQSATEKINQSTTEKINQSTDENTSAVKENTDAQENLQDWIARLIEVQERELSSFESAIKSFEMHSNQNKAIDAYVTKSEEYMKYLRNAQNEYARKANSVELSDDYKKKVRNGTLMIEDIQDENLRDAIQKYQDWYDKSKQLGEQLEEIKQTVREIKIEKLSNIKDDYDNLVSYAESLSNYYQQINDLSEEINLVGDAQALNSALNQQAVIRQTLINEQKELNDQLNALVKSGDIAEYSDTWLEWKTEINDIQKSILDCDSALNQLKKSIREIRLEDFYNSLDQLDFTSDMASSLRGLMSDEGVFDENAKLTNSGIAQLGLMGTELVAAKQKVANYNVAIEALNKDLENGDISQAEYNELLREYQRDQMEAVKATKDAKDAIINLIKNGIEKQTEAMEKLIQKRKDALSLQKEYYDFQKEMEDKSSEMNKIKAQINALSGDDSLEAQQKRRKLQSQLDKLQKEYDDKQKDREHDVIQAAYDETLESFKENQEKTLHELETNLDAQNQAISDALAVAKDNYTVVYEELGVLATEYNVTLTDSIVTPWTDAISAIEQYQSAIEQLNGNVNIDTTPITSDTTSKNQTTPTDNEAKNQNMSKSENGTWIKQDGRWWYEHDDGSYTKNGWEKIDGKWYKFDEKGWMQTGWQPWGTDSKGKTAWYYLNDDGSMATSQWIEYKGKQYFVDHTGVMARYGYIKSKNSGLYYWVNNDGVWEPQWNTYNPDLDKYDLYYAKGSKRVPYSALAYTDDTEDHKLNLGSEAIITNHGVLREVHAGDMIFNEKQKQFLWELSNGDVNFDWQKNIPFVSDFAKNITNMIEKRDIGGDTKIENHYDALVKVVGDVTKEVYPGLQKVCEEAFNYTNKQYKKYSKR